MKKLLLAIALGFSFTANAWCEWDMWDEWDELEYYLYDDDDLDGFWATRVGDGMWLGSDGSFGMRIGSNSWWIQTPKGITFCQWIGNVLMCN